MGNEENANIAPAGTEESATSKETPGETPAAVVKEGEPATPEGAAAAETTTEVPPITTKEPSSAERRIAQLVAQRSKAERDSDYWRGVAEGRKEAVPAQPTPATVVPEGPPKVDQFEVYDDYLVAKAKYEIRQEMKVDRETEERTRTQSTEKEAHQKFMERMEAASEADPELLEDFKDPTLPVSPAMATVIRDSDIAPVLVRHLVDNRKEAARIAKLGPLAAARELGKIEAKLSAPPPKVEKPKTVSQAPEPITTVDTKGKGVVELEDLEIGEFMKRRNAQQFGKRG